MKFKFNARHERITMKYGDIPDGTLTREEKNRSSKRENRAFLEYGISFREP